MTVCEEAQGIVYRNIHFVYMIKRSCIQRVHDLIPMTKQLICLMPGRYVGIEEEEDDGIPFEEKLERLSGELIDLFEKSNGLDSTIKEILRDLGYE